MKMKTEYKYYLINNRYYAATEMDFPIFRILLKRDFNVHVKDIKEISLKDYLSSNISNYKTTVFTYSGLILMNKEELN